MRGTILGFDAASGAGAITDATGKRLRFSRDAWRSPGEPVPGRAVDFEVADGEAIDIFLIPGGFSLGADEPARAAMTAGIVSLSCALISFVIHPLIVLALPVAIGFGLRGRSLGRDLPDRTAYYLSVAGLAIAAFQLVVIILLLSACAGVIGLLSFTSYYWH